MTVRVVLALLAVAAALAVGMVLVYLAIAAFMRVWRRAQAKGCTGPVTPAILMITTFAGLLGGAWLGAVLVRPGADVFVVLASLLGVAVSLGGLALCVHLLPARPVRSGRRRRPRTPFRVLGNLAAVTPPLVMAALLLNGKPATVGVQLMLPMAMLSVLCHTAARRADRIDALPPVDPRPAVVWIRGFGNERRLFGFRRRDKEETRARPELRKVFSHRAEPMSFEEYFAPAIAEELGRGYGLGNPRDYLPPDGIDRHYATDDSWREQFADLVAGARCVVMAPGDWPELRYEFRVIRQLGAHRRLFVLTPPARKARQIRRVNRLKGFRHEDWHDFAAALGGGCGYRLGPDPGPGAVVTFEEDGRAVVLARGAEEPADYVAAVLRHLAVAEHSAASASSNCCPTSSTAAPDRATSSTRSVTPEDSDPP
ncbi:hypothetical protein [Nocardia sp. NRRL S-836]|uniref:hypothetical protein n=1 Tax=Nocardia sp. NRRL S-836 TaxID=1519492 RepID=UPI0006B02F36|nr:hypothetical protein [Nocardia sp. NRRL S-836]KOV90080.1 hypothetical protein ADL03_01690 [Nocardia sp. NRRL S-836]